MTTYYASVLFFVTYGDNPKGEAVAYPLNAEIGFDTDKTVASEIAEDFRLYIQKSGFFEIIKIYDDKSSKRAFDRIPYPEGIDTNKPYFLNFNQVVSFQFISDFFPGS